MSIFKFTNDNKRYHTLHYYNMQKFGERVYKAPINAGFTCPNIDGRRGRGGCIYCDNRTFNPSYCDTASSIGFPQKNSSDIR